LSTLRLQLAHTCMSFPGHSAKRLIGVGAAGVSVFVVMVFSLYLERAAPRRVD
jgi:hypothetical protein